jgi:hypothetical protein
LSRDNRYKLQPTSNGLELNQIRPQDAGDFVCQLQIIGETLEVTHTVEVLGKGSFKNKVRQIQIKIILNFPSQNLLFPIG